MKGLQKKIKGFTLIELVVVIVIIAILAAVALLSFGNFTTTAKNSRIKQEHAQLIAAGNMWRAAQDDPTVAPAAKDFEEIEGFIDSNRELTPKTHSIVGNTLTSLLINDDPLLYDFSEVGPVEPGD